MPKIAIDARPDDTTRERILKAAMLRFSTHSYEETGLRDLAADVGVDSAYGTAASARRRSCFMRR